MPSPRFGSFARTTIVAAVAVVSMAACQPIDTTGTDTGTSTNNGPVAASAAQAAAELKQLDVAARGSMAGYSRDHFKTWDSQGGGCDTRDAVLKRDGRGVKTTSSCKITAGTWLSPYNGKTYTDPQALDIDHLVPLGNAWASGAKSWTADQRESFANDLTRPQLLAVDLSDNRAKGDQDPSTWKPPSHDDWCVYAKDWIVVKTYYKLTVTSAEAGALHDMLSTCA
jgi:hypothetical protein